MYILCSTLYHYYLLLFVIFELLDLGCIIFVYFLFSIFVQVYRPHSPDGNPIALNK